MSSQLPTGGSRSMMISCFRLYRRGGALLHVSIRRGNRPVSMQTHKWGGFTVDNHRSSVVPSRRYIGVASGPGEHYRSQDYFDAMSHTTSSNGIAFSACWSRRQRISHWRLQQNGTLPVSFTYYNPLCSLTFERKAWVGGKRHK